MHHTMHVLDAPEYNTTLLYIEAYIAAYFYSANLTESVSR